MNYSEILQLLKNATLFDLYRLRVGIDGLLEQPERLTSIKRRLRPGMEIAYFSGRENKLMHAVIEQVHRTTVYARDKEDGKQWSIPICSINLENVDTDIHPTFGQKRLEKNQLQVGESIGFYDQKNQERYGTVVQLNQKTASILTKEGIRWRVGYGLLFKVMDGEGGKVADLGLIEGEWVSS